jgi:ABC-type uncharacterized transport system involved in gliding motility auxiliary subunit
MYTVFARNDIIILIVFFAGVIILISCLIFSYKQTEIEGYRRATRSRISITLSVTLFTLILVLFQTISIRHNFKYDTTKNKRFSLSPQTKKILGNLNENIKITSFLKDTSKEKPADEDLFKEYNYLNNNIEYEFINPDRDPMAAHRYNIDSFGTTIVESNKSRERINEISENIITNAIYRVTHMNQKNIYLTTGHGEKSIYDTKNNGISDLAEALRSENYRIISLSLVTKKTAPDNCDILVLAGPTKDILPIEKEIISAYLKNGGKVLFLIDPIVKVPRIADIASEYGIKIENTVIVDRLGVLTSGTYLTPVINRYSDHPITKGFKYFSFFPQARSISKSENADKQFDVTSIFYTNKKAYAETDLNMILNGKTRFEEGVDKQGPISLAATSELARDKKHDIPITHILSPRIAVYGDSDFLTNKILNLYGNKDLILNTINWLAIDSNLISIRPKSNLIQPVLLTMVEGRLVFWLSTIVIPALVGIIGAITLSRKKKNSGSS